MEIILTGIAIAVVAYVVWSLIFAFMWFKIMFSFCKPSKQLTNKPKEVTWKR